MNRVSRGTNSALLFLVAALLLALASCTAKPVFAASETVQIPEASAMYRLWVSAAAGEVFGVDAPEARLAAQLHQESAWKRQARSPAGAQGMAQFMPATAQWIAQRFPEQLGQFDPWDPRQAILAAAIYDRFLLDRVKPIGPTPLTDCSRWAFALRAYNGGEGWMLRERRRAAQHGTDPNSWTAVQPHRVRAAWAHAENIRYPQRILLVLEPAYRAAGWPGQAVC